MKVPFELIIMKFTGLRGKDDRKREGLREAINGMTGGRSDIFFSNSYSGEYAISGFSDNPVGSDIEQNERVIRNAEVLDWMFPRDAIGLKKLSLSTLRWTMHEAVGKMEGVGLSEDFPILGFNKIERGVCRIHYWENGVSKGNHIMDFTRYKVRYRFGAKDHLREAVAYCRNYSGFCICVVSDKMQSLITS